MRINLNYTIISLLLGVFLAACDASKDTNDGPPLFLTGDMTVDTAIGDSGHNDAGLLDATLVDSAVDSRMDASPDATSDSQLDAGLCDDQETVADCRAVAFDACTPRVGSNQATLLVGTVLTGSDVLCNGHVLVDSSTGRIACAGPDCSGHALAENAGIVCADIITPGLIDPHNHMSFNTLPRWRHGARLFQNRNEWRSLIGRELYGARPSSGDPVAARYNELRLLMAATTSVHKAENVRSSHDHVRNVDRGPNAHGLGYGDSAVTECVFPLTQGCSAAPDYENGDNIPSRKYIAHVSEGIDASSLSEFQRFFEQGQLGEQTSIIHCVSCTGIEFSTMRALGADLIWSPQSNIELYGATTDVATALNMGLNVALGPDWTPSGTMNQLAEMKCAAQLSENYLDAQIKPSDIFRMVTDKAAASIGVGDLVGRLSEGMFADVAVWRGDRDEPHAAVLNAEAMDVRAVLVGGQIYYGDSDVFDYAIARNELCEEIALCDGSKTICVRDADGEANVTDPDDWPLFGFYEIQDYVTRVVERRRPEDLPEWLEYVYEPYPLFECNSTFSCNIGNASVSGRNTRADLDGDDVPNDQDNCPDTFNPTQDDLDADGRGDACDTCPWSEQECPCIRPTGIDIDADGIPADLDNCPNRSNADQMDADSDGRGDFCDYCPMFADGPGGGCEAPISDLKRRRLNEEQYFTLSGVVTAVFPESAPVTQDGSFFLQLPANVTEEDAPHAGVYVYMGNSRSQIRTVSVGDTLSVTGKSADYYGQAQLTQISNIERLDAVPIPEPRDLELSQLLRNPDWYEGMLVCISEVIVTELEPESGPGDAGDGNTNEFVVSDVTTGQSMRINDILYLATPFPDVGTSFQRICGVHRLANGHYKIEPRDASDLDAGPPLVVGFNSSRGFVRAGPTMVAKTLRDQAVNILLNRPALEGGQVIMLSSSRPDLLTVPEQLVVPAGASEIQLEARGLREGQEIIVTAKTPTQRNTPQTTLTAYGVDTQPRSIRFEADFYATILEDTISMRIVFDAPLIRGATVRLRSEPVGLLGHYRELTVDENSHSMTFQITGTQVGEGRFSATLNSLTTRTIVEVTDRPSTPIINEINVDMSGPESREFIEIFNPGPIPYALNGVVLELINGSNGEAYASFDLGEHHPELPGYAYLVVADRALAEALPPEALYVPIESRQTEHDIQNGDPDGVQLVAADVVIDALSYGGPIPGVTEGPIGTPDDPNNDAGEGVSRCPNGHDSDDNSADFFVQLETPGQANACEANPDEAD
ncbi:MAG: amidohydrolase family protein [Bradymonadia bacterium]